MSKDCSKLDESGTALRPDGTYPGKLNKIIHLFLQAEDGIRGRNVTGVQTCALPISRGIDDYRSFAAQSERSRLPRFRYLALSRQGTMAMLQGDFEHARQCMDAARSLGEQIGEIGRASCRERRCNAGEATPAEGRRGR